MFNLKDYAGVLMEAVDRVHKNDPNWDWWVSRISETEAEIGWGYLTWMGEKDYTFRLEVIPEKDGTEYSVCGYKPGSDKPTDWLFIWIGNKHWHDFEKLEDGLKSIIYRFADLAHNTY